jgi:hypothetical protein
MPAMAGLFAMWRWGVLVGESPGGGMPPLASIQELRPPTQDQEARRSRAGSRPPASSSTLLGQPQRTTGAAGECDCAAEFGPVSQIDTPNLLT